MSGLKLHHQTILSKQSPATKHPGFSSPQLQKVPIIVSYCTGCLGFCLVGQKNSFLVSPMIFCNSPDKNRIFGIWKKGKIKVAFVVNFLVNSCNREDKSQRVLSDCQNPLQLADTTQLWLVGVGVDFVFPCHKEGRRKNPHLSFWQKDW